MASRIRITDSRHLDRLDLGRYKMGLDKES